MAIRSIVFTLCIGLIVFFKTSMTYAAAVTISYTNLGTFQTAILNQGGVTVSGSSDISVFQNNGLGIVGGTDDYSVDEFEVISFDFNAGTVSNIFLTVSGVDGDWDGEPGEHSIQAFDASDTSLGIVWQGIDFISGVSTFDISTLFGGSEISAITITSYDLVKINQLEYTTIVPVPAAVWLFSSGLLGLISVARRKQSV